MGFREFFKRARWQDEKRSRRIEAKRILEHAEAGSPESKTAAKQRAIELMGERRIITMAYRMFGNDAMESIAKWSRTRENPGDESYIRTISEYHEVRKELSKRYSNRIVPILADEICGLRYGIKPIEKAREYVELVGGLWEKLNETQIESSFKLASERLGNNNKYIETVIDLIALQTRYYGSAPELAIEHLKRKYELLKAETPPLDDKIAEVILKRNRK